jgi:formamidopyrimidine-DNA glycosylase
MGKPLRWPLGCAVAGAGRAHRAGRAPARQVPAARSGPGPAADPSGHVGQPGVCSAAACAGPARPFRTGHHPGQLAPARSASFRCGRVCAGRNRAAGPQAARPPGHGAADRPVRPGRFCTHGLQAAAQRAIKQVLLAGDAGRGRRQHLCLRGAVPAGIRPTVRAIGSAARAECACTAEHPGCAGARGAAGRKHLAGLFQRQGDAGHFQLEAAVYGRAGQPCRVCATPISLLRQGQRSTYFCPHLPAKCALTVSRPRDRYI